MIHTIKVFVVEGLEGFFYAIGTEFKSHKVIFALLLLYTFKLLKNRETILNVNRMFDLIDYKTP